jgi:hypothetical protein
VPVNEDPRKLKATTSGARMSSRLCRSDVGYDEIAEAVDKTQAAVRQIAHRARAHVAARRPRGVTSPTETVSTGA